MVSIQTVDMHQISAFWTLVHTFIWYSFERDVKKISLSPSSLFAEAAACPSSCVLHFEAVLEATVSIESKNINKNACTMSANRLDILVRAKFVEKIPVRKN